MLWFYTLRLNRNNVWWLCSIYSGDTTAGIVEQLGHHEENHAVKSDLERAEAGVRAQSSIYIPRKSLVSLLEEEHSDLSFSSASHELSCWCFLVVSQILDIMSNLAIFIPKLLMLRWLFTNSPWNHSPLYLTPKFSYQLNLTLSDVMLPWLDLTIVCCNLDRTHIVFFTRK